MKKTIGKIPKNDSVDIILMIDDFNEKLGLTIREYVESKAYDGFTKSGTKIPIECFEEFKALINKIKEKDWKSGK